MKTHKGIEVKIPKETFMTFLRERFPELPPDTIIYSATCYEHMTEIIIKLHCEFDPPKSDEE